MPGAAPFLPTTAGELRALGWDACDVVLISGDAYVDHPSFGTAIIGRVLEAQGLRVGVIAQPDWRAVEPFRALGRPRLCFGISAGNMDSMVNHYTSDRRIRSDDAYTPGGVAGARPDRAAIVYAQRAREAFAGVPIVLGGIEASLRRQAHWDYWSETVRRSILLDAKADLLVYGNAERAVVEIMRRLAAGEPIARIDDVRGTVLARAATDLPRAPAGGSWTIVDASRLDDEDLVGDAGEATHAQIHAQIDAPAAAPTRDLVPLRRRARRSVAPPAEAGAHVVLRLPSFEDVRDDPLLYAHASRQIHRESNPGNARPLIQRHGDREVWTNPPPIPLDTPGFDAVFELPYARRPHPCYGDAAIPAYEMIKHSVIITRGCFGGCSFCSITEHEGRIIQNRSQASVLRELARVRDETPGFSGIISDLGGPTANMYRLACKDRAIEAACRRPSCVYPGICPNLGTDHGPLIQLYRAARAVPGIRKVLIASGLRYDLAVESPEYVQELATHHVGGYLKIAPEHVADGPLSKMMKPGIATYDRFKALFDRASKAAGKRQYLIPYFIAAHPGTTDDDMLTLALWLKRNGFRADQVQAFLPSPMATATAMHHTGIDPLRPVRRRAWSPVEVVSGTRRRRLHKAFLRWHDPANWPLLRASLQRMGRAELIGFADECLIPPTQPAGWRPGQRGRAARQGDTAGTQGAVQKDDAPRDRRAPREGTALTQHTGLPPRETDAGGKGDGRRSAGRERPAGRRTRPTGTRSGNRRAR